MLFFWILFFIFITSVSGAFSRSLLLVHVHGVDLLMPVCHESYSLRHGSINMSMYYAKMKCKAKLMTSFVCLCCLCLCRGVI